MFVVYKIENLTNKKLYIGKTKNISERWGDHQKVARGGKAKYGAQFGLVHKTINKYGIDNFILETIKECDSEEEAFKAEQYYIALYKTNVVKYGKEFGYNLTDGGEGASGYKHTAETKAHISEKLSGANHPQFGKPVRAETKKKISKALSGPNSPMFGKSKSIETCRKLSIASQGAKGSNATLTEDQVLEIKELLSVNNMTRKQIGNLFGVSREAINAIAWGRSWSYLI